MKNKIQFIEKENFNRLKDLSYTVRRMFVDEFYYNQIKNIDPYLKTIDLGGKKENKRGYFNIDKYLKNVEYANISKNCNPDYLCDIKNVPVENEIYDIIILSEVIEHLQDPVSVLKEAYRIIKPGGKLYLCSPFLFHLHADPYDYARYSQYWLEENLTEIGFKIEMINKQGLFFSVMLNNIRLYYKQKYIKTSSKLKKKVIVNIIYIVTKMLIGFDKTDYIMKNKILSSFTTGFSCVCYKENSEDK